MELKGKRATSATRRFDAPVYGLLNLAQSVVSLRLTGQLSAGRFAR